MGEEVEVGTQNKSSSEGMPKSYLSGDRMNKHQSLGCSGLRTGKIHGRR